MSPTEPPQIEMHQQHKAASDLRVLGARPLPNSCCSGVVDVNYGRKGTRSMDQSLLVSGLSHHDRCPCPTRHPVSGPAGTPGADHFQYLPYTCSSEDSQAADPVWLLMDHNVT
ncbi:hypothetical protein EYF80_056002 [Liparis tanakae]|uniref:Uncharacterized protein n=1 Tax=Liparis tanakae TaxID=230148 RepID=A0A4Z2EXZ8_9TELE|nr:hypothetical protein EYF80_056002 [Liparis tanakae]